MQNNKIKSLFDNNRIDKIIQSKESELLNILDGQSCIDHQLTLATTNRLDELNDLLLRPSRFDWLIEIQSPTEESRRVYLSSFGLTEDELELFVTKSKELSMAQLKELYVAVKLLDNDIDLVLKRLKDNKKTVVQTTFKPPQKPIGFGK